MSAPDDAAPDDATSEDATSEDGSAAMPPHREVHLPTWLVIVLVVAVVVVSLAPLLVRAAPLEAAATGTTGAKGATATKPAATTAVPVPLQLRLVATVDEPIGVASRPGDPALYILEKAGVIRILRDGLLDPTPALDVSADTSTENERGLLGLAFSPLDPLTAVVSRTDASGAVVVVEMPVAAGGRFDSSRARELLRLPKEWNDHNGGSVAFDETGRLYVGIGDGGGVGDGPMGPGDPFDNAQNLTKLFGKVLRFDPLPPAASTTAATAAARPTIVAYGLRNPWRLSYDPVERVLWIPDVGQSRREEINRMSLDAARPNFGWKRVEGTLPYRGAKKPAGAADPVHEYAHRAGRCAVIGGDAYRGTKIPEIAGWYLFGDLCSGSLSALRPARAATGAITWSAVDLRVGVEVPRGWGADAAGEWYVCSAEGGVWRLERR